MWYRRDQKLEYLATVIDSKIKIGYCLKINQHYLLTWLNDIFAHYLVISYRSTLIFREPIKYYHFFIKCLQLNHIRIIRLYFRYFLVACLFSVRLFVFAICSLVVCPLLFFHVSVLYNPIIGLALTFVRMYCFKWMIT